METAPETQFNNKGDSPEGKEILAPFKRKGGKITDKIEKREEIRNMIKDELSRIESMLEDKEKENLTLNEYYDIYGRVKHLMPIAEKIEERELFNGLKRQADLLEEIKNKRQKTAFDKIKREGWKSFKPQNRPK